MLKNLDTAQVLTRLLAAVVVVLSLVAVVLGAVLYYQSSIELQAHRASGPAPGASGTGEEDPEEDDGAAEEDPSASAQETESAPPVRTVTEVVTPTPAPSENERREPDTAGLTANGWSGNSATRCAAGETLVFAGRGGGDHATLCQSGGELIYRGDVFGGQLRRAADVDRTSISGRYAVIPADPATIVIDGSRLTVRQNGAEANSVNFTEHWWR